MNYRVDTIGNPLNTIDTYEIIAVILLCIDGCPEALVGNIICIFGFENG